jgi:ribosomal protein S18 acetylase RimI-like enzyme
LYERFGFRVAGVRRDYYTDPTEDALVLWREDSDAYKRTETIAQPFEP